MSLDKLDFEGANLWGLVPICRHGDWNFVICRRLSGPERLSDAAAFELSRWRDGRCGVGSSPDIVGCLSLGSQEVYRDPSSAVDAG
jgi:hypothetical protein